MSIVPWIAGRNIRDTGRLHELLAALKPPHVIVLDEPGVASAIKDRLPGTNVIYRWNMDGKDGDLHLRMSPNDWLKRMTDHVKGDRRLMLYTTNEPTLNKALIDWHMALLPLAHLAGYNLCVLNLSTGNPEPGDWERNARPLLDYLATHRDDVLGLHEYFGGVVTSGLIGGNPKFIKPGEWPAIVPFTRWHCGRFQFLLDDCNRAGIRPPRIVITEHGADDTSDIKPWLDTLKKTSPYPNIRGYKTLVNQWREWWPQWSAERAYAEQLVWADDVLYSTPGSPVEAQAVFCYGDSGGWEMFNTENALEFWEFVVKHTQEPQQPPAPSYPPLPFGSDTRFKKWVNETGSNYRVRSFPDLQHAESDMINADEAFDYLPELTFENWIVVKSIKGIVGWCDRGVLEKRLPVPADPPLPLPPPSIPIMLERFKAIADSANKNVLLLTVEVNALTETLSEKNHMLAREIAIRDIALATIEEYSTERKIA